MAIFAKTIDHGSFRAAALALNLSPSVVSHHITQLEEQLGVALIYRSTRRLSLTRDGERLLAAARSMLEEAEAGLSAISDQSESPSGELRVTIPAVLSQSDLVRKIAGFTRDYPNVRLSLDFSDTRRELIGDGFDVAIRMGWLKDSTLKARKLFDVERRLVASRDYAAGKPPPTSPSDIADWDWVVLSAVQAQRPKFEKPGKAPISVKLPVKIAVNDANAMASLALAGAGLAIVPEYLGRPGLESGDLVHILPDWSVEPIGVFTVWPANASKSGLTRLFIDHLLPD